jgi:hypothetical protein
MTEPAAPNRTPALNAALSALQGELPTFGDDKQREVVVEHRDGTSHKYKYVTLNTIMEVVGPLLAKHDLSFTAMPGYNDPGDGKVTLSLRYRLAHSSGQEISGLFPLPGGDGQGTQGQRIQAMGSAISYARRYCLAAVLGIASEHDDDGQAAADLEDANPATMRRNRGQAARRGQAAENTERVRRQSRPDEPPTDEPPTDDAEAPPARRNPDGPVTAGEQRKIFAQFRDLDLAAKEQRDVRLRVASALMGRELTSINDLTSGQAGELIEVLDVVIAAGDALEARQEALTAAIDAARASRAATEGTDQP